VHSRVSVVSILWTAGVAMASTALACQRAPVAPPTEAPWRSTASGDFTVEFVDADSLPATTVLADAIRARRSIEGFFGEPMDRGYHVRLFSDGASLNAYWRTMWNQPSLQRECWMVAAAGTEEIQLLSPRVWSRDACGHDGADSDHLDKIVHHEAIHVHHRRVNGSPSFVSQTTMWWFVEGVAVYASGQLTEAELANIRTRVRSGYSPTSLQEILNGPLGYSGAGSVVRYLDEQRGRATLRSLLRDTTVTALLQHVGLGEAELIAAWSAWLRAS